MDYKELEAIMDRPLNPQEIPYGLLLEAKDAWRVPHTEIMEQVLLRRPDPQEVHDGFLREVATEPLAYEDLEVGMKAMASGEMAQGVFVADELYVDGTLPGLGPGAQVFGQIVEIDAELHQIVLQDGCPGENPHDPVLVQITEDTMIMGTEGWPDERWVRHLGPGWVGVTSDAYFPDSDMGPESIRLVFGPSRPEAAYETLRDLASLESPWRDAREWRRMVVRLLRAMLEDRERWLPEARRLARAAGIDIPELEARP